MANKLKGSLMLLLASIIWGTAFVAQSEGANYLGTFTYNAMRTLVGGTVLIPVIVIFRLVGKKKGVSRAGISLKETIKGGICTGVFLCAASAFQQEGIAHTTVGKAGFVTALYVVMVPLLGVFLKRRVPAVMWLFVALAIAGFWLLCINGDFTISGADLLVLGSAVFYSFQIMTIDRFTEKNIDGLLMSCIEFFTMGIISLVLMLIFEKPEISGMIEARNAILYAGIMSNGVAYTLQILGQKHTAPAVATLLMSLEAVFAALSGWLLLGEHMTVKELLGSALVFAAVILAQFFGGEKSGTKKENPNKQIE